MRVYALIVSVASTGAVLGQPCAVWPLDTAEQEGSLSASVLFDDQGMGVPRAYVSGDIRRFGGITDAHLIRRSGGGWEAVAGAPADIIAMCVQLEGGREYLYVCSYPRVWRYDGAVWQEMPPLPMAGLLSAVSMISFDPDGAGPGAARLYASLRYTYPFPHGYEEWGEVWALGGDWVPVGNERRVGVLAVYDSGSGPRLYTAGSQGQCYKSECGFVSAVSRLDGGQWTTLATTPGSGAFSAAWVHDDDGPGPLPARLCVGGRFTSLTIGGTTSPFQWVAAWDGSEWSALGAGIPGSAGGVRRLTTLDPDGAGPTPPRLLASGEFQRASGSPADGIAAWDGAGWTEFGGGVRDGGVGVVQPFDDDGPGPGLPSLFVNAGGVVDGRIAAPFLTWQGGAWSGLLDGPGGSVLSLAIFNEGQGERLFAAGRFARCGALMANNIARWEGTGWSVVGTGIEPAPGNQNPLVLASTIHNDGSGPALYVAGSFQMAGGVPLANIARWTGTAWQRVGAYGLSGGAVRALEVHDPDGTGPIPARLYAGGEFAWADGAPAQRLAVWDGQGWTAVPGIVQSAGAIRALRSVGGAGGPALYVGGEAFAAGGLPENLAFRLSGGQWQALPSLMQTTGLTRVNVFALHDTGQGPKVHINYTAGRMARLEATGWVQLPAGGVPFSPLRPEAFAARSVDDGLGPSLYANAIRYSSTNAAPLRPEPSGAIRAISPVFDDGSGPAVYMAGEFRALTMPNSASGPGYSVPAAAIARVRLCSPCYANCDGSQMAPVLNVADFICFQSLFAAGHSRANCDGSTAPPVLNVADFVCFSNKYAAGCP